MTPKEAGAMVREWIDRHLRAVLNALACCGVPKDDRPDLAQEVFLTAYAGLLRSECAIEKPSAWLCEIARKKASHYRRQPGRRLPSAPVEAATSALPDPEQGAEQRELVCLLMEQLDEEARGLLLDVRAEGLTWDEVAHERGITIPQAKYLYRLAVQRMEEACREVAPAKRRSFVLTAALEETCNALRAESNDWQAMRDRLWSSIERHVGAEAPTLAHEPMNGPGTTPVSIQFYAPASSTTFGSILGVLGGGIAIGVLLCGLLRDPSGREPVPAETPLAAPTHALVLDEPPAMLGVTRPTVLDIASNGGPAREMERPARPTPASGPRKRLPGPLALLDHARAAVEAEDPWTAIAALAEHARRFPRGPGAAERHHLLALACSIPAARGAPACAGMHPDHVPL